MALPPPHAASRLTVSLTSPPLLHEPFVINLHMLAAVQVLPDQDALLRRAAAVAREWIASGRA